MSVLSVKNLDELSTNYVVLEVRPDTQVILKGDEKNIIHLGCNRFQILLGAAVYLALSNSKHEVVHAGLVDDLILLGTNKGSVKDRYEDGFNVVNSSDEILFSFKRI